jgi:hypothetical protein
VAGQRFADGHAGRQVPDPHGRIVAGGDGDRAAVELTNGDGLEPALVGRERVADGRAGRQVPDPKRPGRTAGDGDRTAVKLADRHRTNPA